MHFEKINVINFTFETYHFSKQTEVCLKWPTIFVNCFRVLQECLKWKQYKEEFYNWPERQGQTIQTVGLGHSK